MATAPVTSVVDGHRLEAHRQERGQPAAVAATSAEAGELRLDHHDAKPWIDLLQVVGRPQPGVPGADDRDVCRNVTRQLGPAGQSAVGERIEPEGNSTGIGHRSDTRQSAAWGFARPTRTLAPMLPTPAGWFPDPWNNTAVRFWDGRGWTRYVAVPAPTKRPPHPTLPSRAAWGAVVTLLLSLTASRYLLKAIAGFEWPIAVYVSIIAFVGYMPSLLWCWYRAADGAPAGSVAMSVSEPAGSMPAGALSPGEHAWSQRSPWPSSWSCSKIPLTSNVRNVSDIHVDRGYVVSLLVLAVVAAPIAEEIVFRGVVIRGLLRGVGP